MNISIVIPNYNGRDLLLENIPYVMKALLQYKGGRREILIIDDGSSDDSLIVLSDLRKKYDTETVAFLVVKNKKNMGFSPTVNKGVAYASGEIIILLNSDVRPYKDFLNPLLPHFTNPGVFAVGCADESQEGEKVVVRGRGIGKWKRGLLVHQKGDNDSPKILWVSGGSGAFRKDLWEKLGGLDSLFAPFYWEDIDLSYRAQKAGYVVIFEVESRVIHEHDKGAIKSGFHAEKIATISYRNQFLFAWKNISSHSLIAQHILWLPVHILLALKRRDTAFLKGLYQACRLLPRILDKRKSVQALVKVDDLSVVGRSAPPQ